MSVMSRFMGTYTSDGLFSRHHQVHVMNYVRILGQYLNSVSKYSGQYFRL